MKKRILVLILAASLTLMSVAGCSNKKSTTVTNEGAQTAATEKVLPPGVEYTANVGEEFVYKNDNMSITFEEVDQTAETAADKSSCMALIFSATNNSDGDLKISMLDDFSVYLDGNEVTYDKLFTALSAANAALLYNGMKRYDAEIEKGKTVKGFVPFQIYSDDWTEMVVQYKPDSANSNDYIKYTVNKADIIQAYKK